MGLIDSYIPDPPLACPRCGATLSDWQGGDGDCLLLLWQQGKQFPIATDWPKEDIKDNDVEAALRSCGPLPPKFRIYCFCDACDRDRPIIAFGQCVGGIWNYTEIETDGSS
jgi:hypothetical protein